MRNWLLLPWLLVACSPLPPLQLPEPNLPETFLAAKQTGAAPWQERWWESFQDQRLNQLQQQLFAGNLDLRQALHRLQQLAALQRSSAAGLWPTLGVSGALSREQTARLNGSGSGVVTNSQVSLAAGYEIDLWQRLADRQQAARLRQQAGRHEILTLQLSLSAQLAEQYFLAAEQRAQLRFGREQVTTYRELLENLAGRYRAGLAGAAELYLARQNLALAEARLPDYQATLQRAENSIALLLGQLPRPQWTDLDRLPPLSSLSGAGLPASLLTRRPDIGAALLQLQASDRDLAAALAERLPAVNLTATLGRSVSQAASGSLEGSFWSLALGLTQPLFDAGRRQAEADRQLALRDERLAGYRQAILTAVQEVETALSNDQNSAQKQLLLEQQLSVSHQELQLARANYRSGLNDSSSLLASELRYLEVGSQVLTNQRLWLTNRITLARALGGSWMAEELDRQLKTLAPQQD
jgi:NodT family efflux transporter outer membrane factor (OMF) lipoprotein